ncbi:MAG: hypothetical protein K8T26_09030, partial [Lentisphaerae bacterium]|nr:hypothetical protein [Lentisphaerota bacterium]
PAGLVALLRAQLDAMGLPRIRRNDHAMAIRRLEAFIATLPTPPTSVDELLLNAFEDWLVQGEVSRRGYHRKTTSHLRSVVNAMPEAARNRRLLTNTELNRLHRFDEFTPETKALLHRFLADGRKVKRGPEGLRSTSALLSASVRESAVYAATMVMRIVGIDDVRNVSKDHLLGRLGRDGEGSPRRAGAAEVAGEPRLRAGRPDQQAGRPRHA